MRRAIVAVLALLATGLTGCGMGDRVITGTAIGVAEDGTKSDAHERDTRTTVLEPVDADGFPARGWRVDPGRTGGSIDCSYPESSPSAVSDDIVRCTPNAAAADTCFAADDPGQALCLIDPFSNTVVEYAVAGAIAAVTAPADPRPIGLVLDNGDKCRLRVGGAWSAPESHPDYVGYYSCDAAGDAAIWGPPEGGGIDESASQWSVEYGWITGQLTTQRVVEAFYTGRAE
ncbi:hypothetical protein OG921_17805 [Aldersonia sp. NBC_00410]|uniref:hypothetical protein n=1 Tax=Aldersonia sp. NBC_00410 TaxID=2975954 RepID=UPI00224CB0CC|nr:hypothetical protein [Aldersonia sp. NBC_00410]MCX5045025.1 hypothetical protein [Aldersonia sp. NBC_00410]